MAGLKTFMAGLKWAKNFVKRQNLQSKVVHGEAGSVNEGLIKEGMGEIREACKECPPSRIFNVDETGILWNLMPKRTYLSIRENQKTARGTKTISSRIAYLPKRAPMRTVPSR